MRVLETKRLILRCWEIADAEQLFELCSDAEVMIHIGDGLAFENIERARKFLSWAVLYQKENGFCRWAVIEKESQKIIGSCGFVRLENGEIELGYLFAKDFWGKGLATEAARACLSFGFESLGFAKIVALTDLDHIATHRVLEKSGLIRRGVEKNGEFDDLVFELTSSDYNAER